MVVPVLITNCQVDEKWNIGPANAHTPTRNKAVENIQGDPAHWATFDANESK